MAGLKDIWLEELGSTNSLGTIPSPAITSGKRPKPKKKKAQYLLSILDKTDKDKEIKKEIKIPEAESPSIETQLQFTSEPLVQFGDEEVEQAADILADKEDTSSDEEVIEELQRVLRIPRESAVALLNAWAASDPLARLKKPEDSTVRKYSPETWFDKQGDAVTYYSGQNATLD